ncbi:hypothetical protein V8F33_003797 [Rhypophila sp. PSN 637]
MVVRRASVRMLIVMSRSTRARAREGLSDGRSTYEVLGLTMERIANRESSCSTLLGYTEAGIAIKSKHDLVFSMCNGGYESCC